MTKWTDEKPNAVAILFVILAFVAIIGVSFLATAGILRLICWAFDLTWWSWKTSFGVWLAIALASSVFTSHIKVEK